MHIMNFPEYLERKFLTWQQQQGKRKTIVEFANYLGVSQAVLSMWLNGSRSPNQSSVQLLSKTFGDEVYDALGLPRPNENLSYIEHNWDNLPPEQQRALREQAEKYVTKHDRSKKD
jgi:transcriptional regulator with XRE-family HTH domain